MDRDLSISGHYNFIRPKLDFIWIFQESPVLNTSRTVYVLAKKNKIILAQQNYDGEVHWIKTLGQISKEIKVFGSHLRSDNDILYTRISKSDTNFAHGIDWSY